MCFLFSSILRVAHDSNWLVDAGAAAVAFEDPGCFCATSSSPSGRNTLSWELIPTFSSSSKLVPEQSNYHKHTSESRLTAANRQEGGEREREKKVNANGMLSLFTGLERSPKCYQADSDFVWRLMDVLCFTCHCSFSPDPLSRLRPKITGNLWLCSFI